MEALTLWLNRMSLLTTSQQNVVQLAAEGHTNREIAENLGITEGTVKVELCHSFKKLGITGKGSRYRIIIARTQASLMPPLRLQELVSA